MTAAVIKFPSTSWAHPCSRFFLARSMKFCGICGFAKVLHPKLLPCSQCGEQFVAGDGETHGFSECVAHAERTPVL